MKTSLLLSTALLVTGTALADVNYNMAIDQAKRVANNPGPSQPSQNQHPPANRQAPKVNPELAATMKNIANLQADIAALVKARDAASAADQKSSLMNHLYAAAQGSKATPASVQKLAGDLIAIVTRKNIPPKQQTVLARNLHAMFNGAHLSTSLQHTLLDAVKKIVTQAGASTEEADKLAADLQAIARETK